MQRKIALKILLKTIKDSSFTNLLMRKDLECLPEIQRAFVTYLVNGVLQNYDLLNFQHESYYQKCSIRNKLILSMACFEKFMMNEKDYVVVNEYTNLGESTFDKGFLNAILRKIDKLQYSKEDYINYSLPKWLYSLLKAQYNEKDFKTILTNYKRIPLTYYHINKKKCSFKDLEKQNIQIINDSIFTSKSSLLNTKEFKEGYFYIQDINATSLIDEFHFNENDLFLDACAAPGSKLFNALDFVKEENCYANDLNPTRVDLIKQKAQELGYFNIHYLNYDASLLDTVFDFKFDKILLDVPCSGLGVIARKPDIKFHIQPTSLDELQTIQYRILNSCSKLLKDDGELVYATCTLNRKENDKQVQKFLKEHEDFKLIEDKTTLNLEGDLFYVALLKKV